MRVTRVYVDAPLAADGRQLIEGTAANHIVRVLRLRAGDALTLFDGRGGEYDARIEESQADSVRVLLGGHKAVERESPIALTLIQGISRGERMDWVVQKATELGVRWIVPVLTERSVVRLDANQAQNKRRHWRAVAVAACEQCGRNRLPEVAAPLGFAALLASLPVRSMRLMLSPAGTLRVRDLPPAGPDVQVLIGPEGGLSEAEQSAALAAGFAPLRLGPRILRTETAALAALAAIQQQLGDL